jgi:phosphoglycerate dehydrogenase-like enzyme
MDRLPKLEIIANFGVGYDSIDTKAARARNIRVTNTPNVLNDAMAEITIGLMISLARKLPQADQYVRQGKWPAATFPLQAELNGKTLGILGLGRIGKRMSYVARNVFGPVMACDPYLIDGDFPAYVRRVSKEELFRRADVVSLHVPLNDETRGLVDARLLSLMKPGSYLVNTSRGAVVKVEDVVAAVDSGRLDGAALDVLPTEPPAADDAILRHPRILLTPHAAFYSVEGERELRRKAAQNLIDWAATGRPPYVVVEGKNG